VKSKDRTRGGFGGKEEEEKRKTTMRRGCGAAVYNVEVEGRKENLANEEEDGMTATTGKRRGG